MTLRYRKFHTLKELETIRGSVSLFAVVSFYRRAEPSRGPDYSLHLHLLDPTVVQQQNRQPLSCVLFEVAEKNFPLIQGIGDVVKFTKLTVKSFRSEYQGLGSTKKGFTWSVFDGHIDAPIVPRCQPGSRRSRNVLPDDEKQKIEELKKWALTVENLSPTARQMPLEKLTEQTGPFDLVCQIVSFDIFDHSNNAYELHVWDGTIPGLATLVSWGSEYSVSTCWGNKPFGKCVKIYVFYDMPGDPPPYKAGDYILINGVVLVDKPDVSQKVKVLKLSYQRNSDGEIKKLLEDEVSFTKLRNRMKTAAATVACNVAGSLPHTDTNLPAIIPDIRPVTCEPCQDTDNFDSIGDMIRSPRIPSKFIVQAKVYAYMPKKAKNFVKYSCFRCRTIDPVGEFDTSLKSHAQRACTKEGCEGDMSLTLLFSLILRDDTDFIDVVLFDRDARAIFPNLDLVTLLTDTNAQELVEKNLNGLTKATTRGVYEIESYSVGPQNSCLRETVTVFRVTAAHLPRGH